ncbi:CheW protein [Anaeromyxobacter dehalogenans 2CP-1]|uniref:CheW protein n=1 Tax=Anaeromyxobacter dehalogenans (strain ATCC BAA-258 / DSM 21875 / 2CP-1) TaxID=455488 RepID=B8JCH5_ANAD2|nr:chemotaxis protein CheW [Anaeromyxobacter dehalogenans]ACL65915.1 CheW protein [Anaeromyxobacter dehalogenans 2CP-1]
MTTELAKADGAAGTATELGRRLAGKYMTFQLAREEYGIEILTVREIIGLLEMTRVPRTRDFIRGVINLRGKVIPVIDLRLKFGMERCEPSDQTVIIVVHCAVDGRPLTMGLLVDQVLEVLSIGPAMIEPTPALGQAAPEEDFILGVGKHDRRIVFLLDIARILSSDDARELGRASAAGAPAGVTPGPETTGDVP